VSESGTEADVSRETKTEQLPRVAQTAPAKPAKKTWAMKAGNNWDSAVIPTDNPRYALDIPAELVPPGMVFQWETRSIYGQPMQQRLNASHAAGWTDVHESDFEGIGSQIASMFETDASGYIVKEACILQARPLELHQKAVERDKRQARAQLELKAQAFTGGQIGATGADHPSALGSNRISRTMERVEIPKE